MHPNHHQDIMHEMETLFLSERTDLLSQEWNNRRREVLREALTHLLYPLFERELRAKLIEEAQERVAGNCGIKLTQKLMAGPFQPKEVEYYETPEDIQVMGIVYGSGNVPTMAVMLDAEGEVKGHLRLPYISLRTGGVAEFETRKTTDQEKLNAFIVDNDPHVIAIAAQVSVHHHHITYLSITIMFGMDIINKSIIIYRLFMLIYLYMYHLYFIQHSQLDARRLYEDLQDITARLEKDRKISHHCHVTYVDLEIPKIFANSSRADSEFPEFPAPLRQAVSLARCLMDPMTELASLSSDTNELLCLQLDPLQGSIQDKNYLVKMLERCFINVVNAVGVDINSAVMHKHAAHTLQHVAGFGPRKAAMLIQNIYR